MTAMRKHVHWVGIVYLISLFSVLIIIFFSTYMDKGKKASGNALYIEVSEDTFLIPLNENLEKMDKDQLAAVYWRYVNTIQVLCRNPTRLGSLKDGGKEICLDRDFKPKRRCLVYSFGSGFKFDFELAVIHAFGCEVHTFDPTMDLNKKGKTVPKSIHFHQLGLGEYDHVTKDKWDMKTLDTIMKELNHEKRTIDILKIDIEDAEWKSLAQMFTVGTLQRVKQLAVEFHYKMPGCERLKVLRGLYDQGFQIFMRDRNLSRLKPFRSGKIFVGDDSG